MNKNLRKEILKEIKFLLNEAESVDYNKAKAGGSYGSGGTGRTVGTAAAGLGAVGAAGLGAGAIAAGGLGGAGTAAGLGTMSALGGGAAASAVGGIVASAAFPVVAIGALVLGAAYLAFRTAGWKEVAQDIVDAKVVKDDEVAKRLSTKQYIDLTTMEDATDESDMKSFMAAMKGLTEAYAETETLEEYKDFIEQSKSQKGILDKVCNNFVLLNEFGQNDRMYFVKCAKVAAYQPPAQAPTVEESLFLEAEAASTQPTTAAQPPKCVKIEGIQIPYLLFNVGLENEISDSVKTFKAPGGELPAITCPLIEKICGTGEQPTPSPTPKPEEGNVGAQGKNSFKCPNQEDVAVFQQWLGVKEDCSVGVNTIKAAQGKGMTLNLQDYFSAGSLTPEQKQKQIQFCNSLKTNRPGYEAEIKKSGQTVRGKCSATSGGGSGKKPQTKPSQGNNTGKCVDGKAAPFGIDSNCFRLDNYVNKFGFAVNQDEYDKSPKEAEAKYAETKPQQKESKNYYDNKKLNEAKTLFNKLLKNL